MGLKTYKATEVGMAALKKLLGYNLRVSGAEHLPDRPTMFVSNHFTRIETFLTPYALFLHTRRQVRSLGNHSIFKGVFGRYIQQLGSMSLKNPRRNRIIIRELMTGTDDWLIYPEGGLVKNKQLVSKGKLHLNRPARNGPPHTGAALMALKAEISKRRYREACRRGDVERRSFYEDRYSLTDPSELSEDGIVVVPVNITFYPLRPGSNPINRMARRLCKPLDPRLEEELMVEGRLLLGGTEIVIHFGEPIEVADYLDRPTRYARRIVGALSEVAGGEFALTRQARKLTEVSMRRVYETTEVNLDHLFGSTLMRLNRDEIDVDDLHRVMYLAANELTQRDVARVHPSFRNGISRLLAGAPYPPLQSIVDLAEESGVLHRQGATYHIDRETLHRELDFHQERLRNPIRVIANEMQAVGPATSILQRLIEMPSTRLRRLASEQLVQRDLSRFEEEYEAAADPVRRRARVLGEPFFRKGADGAPGVVLIHGYLGCPEQMRPLADTLHERGLSVYGVRLSGHGTSPCRLPLVSWSDWIDDVYRGIAVLRQHCPQVALMGFSFGGMLALRAAARLDSQIDALVSINAPLHLRGRRLRWLPFLLTWERIRRLLHLADGPASRPHHTESPGINYDHHYLEAVSELRRAIHASRQTLGDVKCPVMLMQSEDDPLVDPDSGRALLAGLNVSTKILEELPFDRHMIVRGAGSELVHRKIMGFLDGVMTMPAREGGRRRRRSA